MIRYAEKPGETMTTAAMLVLIFSSFLNSTPVFQRRLAPGHDPHWFGENITWMMTILSMQIFFSGRATLVPAHIRRRESRIWNKGKKVGEEREEQGRLTVVR